MRQIGMKTPKTDPSVIGIDLGGSKVRMAIVSLNGERLGRVFTVPVTDRNLKAVLALLADSIRKLPFGLSQPSAIGIGIPGFIQMEKSRIYRSPNFPGWRNVPIRDLLEEKLKYPVWVENDANAAAYGESWVGCGKKVKSLLYLGLGTGVGGGVVLDRQVWHGREGMAGELGHITVDPDGPLCGCGSHGCLESYASATAVVKRFKEKAGPEGVDKTAHEVAILARRGHQKASAVFRDLGRALGIAIADLLNIFDPDRIAIGGGVAAAWTLFERPMMDEVGRRAIRPMDLKVKIRRGRLKDEAGIIGAAGLAFHQLGRKVF